MAIHFKKSSNFDFMRLKIEDYLYESVLGIEKSHDMALKSVEIFVQDIEKLVITLEGMYLTPSLHDLQGEKSFPVRNGRYRVFYKVSVLENADFEITFIDIDDNRQSNLDRFPTHLISFDDD